MPTKIEKDIVTGRDTTGHEWDGLKELNTPLPKWWVYVLYATIVWSAGVVRAVSVGARDQRLFPRRAGLFAARGGGRRCARGDGAACRNDGPDQGAVVRRHPQGSGAYGGGGHRGAHRVRQQLPALPCAPAAAGSRAIRRSRPAHGSGAARSMRSSRPSPTASAAAMTKARESQMPRFGADGVLKPVEIQQVADYVMTLYGDAQPGKDVAAGEKLFAENCAICHGEAGQGDREKGAPRLASRVHLYGDDRAHRRRADHRAADGRDAGLAHPPRRGDDQEPALTCIRWAAANRTERNDVPHQQGRPSAPAPARGGRRSPLRQPRAGLSEVGARTGAPVQMGGADRLPRHLLPAALAALASRRQPAGPGGAAVDLARALLFLQSRVLAAGHLLPDRPADHGRGHAVPGHQPARPRLVRLHLSADGVDRSVHVDRAPDRRRPQRTHEARRASR